MSEFRRAVAICVVAMAVISMVAGTASAQYWFQSGARGYNDAAFNSGAGIAIETVPQNIWHGTMAFWIGETLSNGAFIQVGYLISNSSAYYNSNCSPGGCNGSVFVTAGNATWFWEYFPAGYNGTDFYGSVGPDGSAGMVGAFNNYSFKSAGNIWTVYFNNRSIGSVDLGVGGSGPYPPSAFGEYVGGDNITKMNATTFRDMEFYSDGWHTVGEAYRYVGYGRGSETGLANTYGVAPVGEYANYFRVGSGLPTTPDGMLWSRGYNLDVNRGFGGANISVGYEQGASVSIGVPELVYSNDSVRELFVGWKGGGVGSYTGPASNATVDMNANISETALWRTQYYLDVSSEYGNAMGAGWYDANSVAIVSVNVTNMSVEYHTRALFDGWSDGKVSHSDTIAMHSPRNVSAIWRTQYLLVASATYGNTSGGGWYDANSTARVSLNKYVEPVNDTTRYAFLRWSDGATSETDTIEVNGPIFLYAIFKPQYLVHFAPQDSDGSPIYPEYLNVSSRIVYGSEDFFFPNTTYNIEYAYYKGTKLVVNHAFDVSVPGNVTFRTPVYDIALSTRSLFGTPVNASVNITFRNGSSMHARTGSEGLLLMEDVPYGYVDGSVGYIGFVQHVRINSGGAVYLRFFTVSVVLVAVGGAAFIVAVKVAADAIARGRR